MNQFMRWSLATVLALAAGVGSFTATLAARSGQNATSTPTTSVADDPFCNWLRISDSQQQAIAARDPGFTDDLTKLRNQVQAKRAELAAAFEKVDLSEAQVREKSDSVIAASAALERRVTDHLLQIRDHLSPDQRRQLFGF